MRIFRRGFFIFSVCFCSLSCSNPVIDEYIQFDYCTLSLILPVHPLATNGKEIQDELFWLIKWRDKRGARRQLITSLHTPAIRVDRGSCTPVLAWPLCFDYKEEEEEEEENIAIHSLGGVPLAGSIYPHFAQTEGMNITLIMNGTGGILAETADLVIRNAFDGTETGLAIAAHFNWNRLCESMDSLENPHLLDRAKVAGTILCGRFTQSAVRERPYKFVDVDICSVKNNEIFRAGSPFSTVPVFIHTASAEFLLPLADGVNLFYSTKGILTVVYFESILVCSFYTLYPLPDPQGSDTVECI